MMSKQKRSSRHDDHVMILVVENSITQAEKLVHTLVRGGYDSDYVNSARKCLDYLAHHPVTIVISDVVVPDMDGFQLCTAIKQDGKFSHIAVVLMTTLSDPGDIVNGLECGADNFIAKPYEKEYLLSQMEYMLANIKLRRLSQKQCLGAHDMGMEIYFAGKKHYIKSSQLQILDLLISTFEVFVRKNQQLVQMNKELAEKNERIKTLSGLIPICANCKKIRDDLGYWTHVDQYLERHSDVGFNRSICPDCLE